MTICFLNTFFVVNWSFFWLCEKYFYLWPYVFLTLFCGQLEFFYDYVKSISTYDVMIWCKTLQNNTIWWNTVQYKNMIWKYWIKDVVMSAWGVPLEVLAEKDRTRVCRLVETDKWCECVVSVRWSAFFLVLPKKEPMRLCRLVESDRWCRCVVDMRRTTLGPP